MPNFLTKLKKLLTEPILSPAPESYYQDFDELWDSGQPFTQHTLDNCITTALEAETLEEAIQGLNLANKTADQLEDLAWAFAFWNGNSKEPPTEREEALATACLNQLDGIEL